MTQAETIKKPSKNARKSAARLVAAQLIYEHFLTKEPYAKLIEDYQYQRVKNPIDELEEGDSELVPADMNLLEEILSPLTQHAESIVSLATSAVDKQKKDMELLLKAIVMAASSEFFTAADRGVDSPIIMNDYLNVTRAFFGEGEVKYINGILNHISKAV